MSRLGVEKKGLRRWYSQFDIWNSKTLVDTRTLAFNTQFVIDWGRESAVEIKDTAP
jgi:hypothetical protein